MKVLVTGGTGVIGKATVTELLRRGHAVRLLSRGAEEDAGEWNGPVEAFAGDVSDAASVSGAAEGCAAVIHLTGIVEESPPEVTFERVNVDGTRHIVAEAIRAGARRLIHVSSLGVDRGETDYHRSKLQGEAITRDFTGSWTIARVGAVMGPGDDTVSVLLRMMRTLPAVPVIGDGEQPFQPVWHEDVAAALVDCLERSDLTGRTLNLTGADIVTVRQVIDLFGQITDRQPLRLPLPAFLAKVGSSLASALGVETPVSAATVQMLLEGNYLRDDETNDLVVTLGHQPLPTRNRLVELADALPEQTPDQGVGKLQRRQFTTDIRGSALSATQLLQRFREQFSDVVPFEAAAEPGAPTRIDQDATLTLQLPARGHVQVRVEQVTDHTFTLATLEGHPLAGVVRFQVDDRDGDAIRFAIDVIERPASRVDQISMALGGSAAQTRAWKQTARNVAELAGGTADDVEEESWRLDDDDAEPLEEWVRDVVQRRRRAAADRT
jgi:nucleoside-diphosphate-sugar epimerase